MRNIKRIETIPKWLAGLVLTLKQRLAEPPKPTDRPVCIIGQGDNRRVWPEERKT